MWRKRSHYTRVRSGLCDRLDEAEAAVLRGAAKVICAVVCLGVSLASANAAPAERCGPADLSELTKKVYVTSKGTDAAGCGTTAGNACKTIQQGIKECNGAGCGVLVRHGKYELQSTIELASGVSLYGSCEFEVDAATPLTRYRSVILAPPGGLPAISATGINTKTVLHGFNVLGSDAETPGAPSIAIFVKDSKGKDSSLVLLLKFNQFISGKGAPGASAQSPGRSPSPAALNGANGATSYVNEKRWCEQTEMNCDKYAPPGGRSASGRENGGSGEFMHLHWQSNYNSNCDWQSSKGEQGKGEHGGEGGDETYPGAKCAGNYKPGDGGPGRTATVAGSCASRGGKPSPDYVGSFDTESSTWKPSPGGQGENGGSGSGGGGGGGGGSCISNSYDRQFIWYAQGGGGGAGGQGGVGGPGGQQGGASFPLFLIRSPLQTDFSNFIPGPGGDGGRGGDGGLGGYGGAGGKGGVGRFDTVDGHSCPGTGGDGGGGSQGGAAAGGAGGNGGPSIPVAHVPTVRHAIQGCRAPDRELEVGFGLAAVQE